mgnify:FL=1
MWARLYSYIGVHLALYRNFLIGVAVNTTNAQPTFSQLDVRTQMEDMKSTAHISCSHFTKSY